jgi:DNA-binding MarR family transcriptional regulator
MRKNGRPRLVLELLSAERSVRRWVDARSGESGIGAAGAGVLFFLAGRADALVGEVAAALHASPAGATGLLNRLAAAGLVSKAADPHDGRSVRVALTAGGLEAAGTAQGVVNDLNALLCQGFSASELDTVDRWLRHATDVLHPERSA